MDLACGAWDFSWSPGARQDNERMRAAPRFPGRFWLESDALFGSDSESSIVELRHRERSRDQGNAFAFLRNGLGPDRRGVEHCLLRHLVLRTVQLISSPPDFDRIFRICIIRSTTFRLRQGHYHAWTAT